jgi:hypothetical protein
MDTTRHLPGSTCRQDRSVIPTTSLSRDHQAISTVKDRVETVRLCQMNGFGIAGRIHRD